MLSPCQNNNCMSTEHGCHAHMYWGITLHPLNIWSKLLTIVKERRSWSHLLLSLLIRFWLTAYYVPGTYLHRLCNLLRRLALKIMIWLDVTACSLQFQASRPKDRKIQANHIFLHSEVQVNQGWITRPITKTNKQKNLLLNIIVRHLILTLRAMKL